MKDLMLESAETDGARKLLCKLGQEFSMSLTPSVKMPCKSRLDGKEGYDYFPLPTRYRKLAGEGMIRWLLESKDNMRKYLYDNPEFYAHYEFDKKGNVKRINITAK
jgi:hypothetical protein